MAFNSALEIWKGLSDVPVMLGCLLAACLFLCLRDVVACGVALAHVMIAASLLAVYKFRTREEYSRQSRAAG